MIIKSLIIASVIFNSLGLQGLSHRFDSSVIREQYGENSVVSASDNRIDLPDIAPRPQLRVGSLEPQILAHEYLLANLESNKILLKQSIRKKVPIASTTKIMTAVVALENYDLDDIITVSSTAASQPGADVNLRAGEKIMFMSLLKSLLIKSGNDAAYALAEHMNKDNNMSITNLFVQAMNEKAKGLGMEDTYYKDPAGLDTTGYSTAYDLYLVTKYALGNKVFADIVRTDHTVVSDITGSISHDLKNSNRLVGEYKYMGAIGVKTGYMPEAGHILVSAAERDNHTLVGIIINTFADTAPASADESQKMLDWGWENVVWGLDE